LIDQDEIALLKKQLQEKDVTHSEKKKTEALSLEKRIAELEKDKTELTLSYQSQLENATRYIQQQTSMMQGAQDQIASLQQKDQGDGGSEENEEDYEDNYEAVYQAYRKGQEKLSQAQKFVDYQEKLLSYKDEQVAFYVKLVEIKDFELKSFKEQLKEYKELDELTEELLAEDEQERTNNSFWNENYGSDKKKPKEYYSTTSHSLGLGEDIISVVSNPFEEPNEQDQQSHRGSRTPGSSVILPDAMVTTSPSQPQLSHQHSYSLTSTAGHPYSTPPRGNNGQHSNPHTMTNVHFPQISPKGLISAAKSVDRRDLLHQLQKKEAEIIKLQEHLRVSVDNESAYRTLFMTVLDSLNHLLYVFQYSNDDLHLLVEFSSTVPISAKNGNNGNYNGSRSRRRTEPGIVPYLNKSSTSTTTGGEISTTGSNENITFPSVSFLTSSSSFLSFHSDILSTDKYQETLKGILEKVYQQYKQLLVKYGETKTKNHQLREENERKEKENNELMTELSDAMPPFLIN
jgi:hypothetical protein